MKTATEIFEEKFRQLMVDKDVHAFYHNYPTLTRVINESMNAYKDQSVVVNKEMITDIISRLAEIERAITLIQFK